jgi:hypothetical protein
VKIILMPDAAGPQFMGIPTVAFCPMPAVTVAKTWAPYATSGAASSSVTIRFCAQIK